MSIEISLLPCAIADITAHAASSGVVTLADRYGLMAAILAQATLQDEEREAIDRLIYAVYRGRITVTNELSVVL